MTISTGTEAFQEDSTLLIEEIEEAVQNRDWANVHRLAWVLMDLEGSLDLSLPSFANPSTSRIDIDNDIRNSHRSSSSLSSRISDSGLYDRLTVLQAAPLVYFCSDKVSLQPWPPLNFRWEKEELVKALEDAREKGTIDVAFDVATPGRLNAFLANGERSPILHISCHGMVGGELVFENGLGREKFITVNALEEYQLLSSLKAVFVSACHSRSIGEAFVDAGVRHVVCCTNEAKLKDSAAIQFTGAFYRALAYGQTLKVAFELAKNQVMHSPFIDESHLEVDKFILLPERDDDYHSVQIFFERPSLRPPGVETVSRRIIIPSLPDHFMDRKREAFGIINHFEQGCDVVQLVGPEGIGKTALATFVATYVSERHHVNKRRYFSNVLCFLNEESRSLEHMCLEMNKLVDKDKSTLLVLDADTYAHHGKAVLTEELQKILNLPTTVKMLIVSEHEGAVEFPTSIVVQEELKPLTYHAMVTLFATLCRHVKENSHPMVHSVHEFLNLVFRRKCFLEEREVIAAMPKRGAELFIRLGAGYPKEIVRIAKTLSPEGYKDIICKAKKYDMILKPFETRHELDCAMLEAELERYKALKRGLIHKAQTEWDIWLELERLSETKPSMEKLKQEYDQVKANLKKVTDTWKQAYYSNRSAVTELSKRKKDLYAKLKDLNFRIELEEIAKKKLSATVNDLNCRIELEEGANRISERVSRVIYGDQAEATSDEDAVEDIPKVAEMFVVDDSAASPPPIPAKAVHELLTCRITFKHPFLLRINQGPTQSFSYSMSDKAAIVVASNEACTGGQGILRAVTDAGGPALLQKVNELPVALHSEFGQIRCLAGDAKIVGPGSFGTLEVPYVMFAVGPWFTSENEEHRLLFLTGAYRSALESAEFYKLEAVAFSLIGSSCRGGESWKETIAIGLKTIIHFHGYPELKEIHLFGFTSEEATELRERSVEASANFEHIDQLMLS